MFDILLGTPVQPDHARYDHELMPLRAPNHPSTVRLCAYWQQCTENGGMRMSRDIPSRALASLLPFLTIAEPVDNWADARIRLAGQSQIANFGREIGGELLTDLFGSKQKEVRLMLAGARHAIHSGQPQIADHIARERGRVVLHHEMVALPLLAPDSEKLWLLAGVFPF